MATRTKSSKTKSRSKDFAPNGKFAASVVNVPVEDEMSEAFLAYSMSVISSRAIPDVRDGLKPVQRRILYSMLSMGIRPDSAFKKCAKVVGDTMGNYHPHGDTAIYDALVRMGQDFSRGIILVEPQGNFGSLDDPPAAPRYTECRLSEPAMAMLSEINEGTVDFRPTYDGESEEPVYLPSLLPNLLVNGVTGIAVGVTTNISPHNLAEVAEAIKLVMKKNNPKPKVEELLAVMPGPDFPSGGTIIDDGLKEIYKKGRGSFRLRAKTEIVSLSNKKQGIIVTELPYLIGPEKIISKIKDLMLADRLPEVTDIKNLSDRKVGLRIQIECRINENPAVLLQKLFKLTPLEEQHFILNSALVKNVPVQLSLQKICEAYIAHRLTIIKRRTEFRLEKTKDRLHIVLGLLKALDRIDEVIKIIRSSKTVDDARKGLRDKLQLTIIQADSILEMRLRRLTALEKQKVEDEKNELTSEIKSLEKLLGSEAERKKTLKKELEAFVEKFGRERCTLIISPQEIEDEEITTPATAKTVTEMPCLLTLATSGVLGWRPLDDESERAKASRNDVLAQPGYKTLTTATAWAFTSQGRNLTAPISSLGQIEGSKRGTNAQQAFGTNAGEEILFVMPDQLQEDEPLQNLMVVTESGTVKQLDTSKLNSFKAGKDYINLKESDKVVAVFAVPSKNKNEEIALVSSNAQILRVRLSEFRPLSPTAAGITGMNLKDGGTIIGAGLCSDEHQIIAVTNKAKMAALPIAGFATKKRSGMGVKLCPLKGSEKIQLVYIHQLESLLAIVASEEKSGKVDAMPLKINLNLGQIISTPQNTEQQILEIGIDRWK